MEVQVYLSADNWHKHKSVFFRRSDSHPDLDKQLGIVYRSMKILFGVLSLVVFVCV